MTLQTGKKRHDWRRVLIGGVASGAMAASLLTGFGVSTAFAEPIETFAEEQRQAADGRDLGMFERPVESLGDSRRV